MNPFNKGISFFSIYYLLLCLFINFYHLNSMPSNVDNQAIIGQIHESLALNQHQIDKLTQKLQFRSKINPISTKINLTHHYEKLYRKLPVFTLEDLQQSSEAIQFSKSCQVLINKKQTVSMSQINYNFISSQGEYFIFINNHHINSLLIYDFNCTFLTSITDLTVKFFFPQQSSATKGGYQANRDDNHQSQSVFAISDKDELIEFDIQSVKKNNRLGKASKQEDNALLSKFSFYRVLNNKIITPGSNQKVIGVVSKTLASPKPRTKQQHPTSAQKSFLIALDSSQINIYDESGTLKLTMKEPSAIGELYEELNGKELEKRKESEKSLQLVNHHPHPILLEDNWVYFIDTNKYTRQPWNCPYIPNIRKIFVQNIHANDVYVLTQTHILKFNIKAKDVRDAKRGQCELQSSISYFDPDSASKKPQEIVFSLHKNLIFLNNLVYNMTANSYYVLSSSQIKVKNEQKIECSQSFLQYIPFTPNSQMKKPQSEKSYTIVMLCKCQQSQYLQLYSVTELKSQSSVLIYVIFAFLLVIFFSVKFFKSSGTNYQRQLLYSMDLNAEDKQARKEHYDQLCKYMDQASKVQKEGNENKSHPRQKTSCNKVNDSRLKKQ